MTLYFFNVRDHQKYLEDDEGVELLDLDAAITEAKLAVRELLADMLLKGEVLDGQVFEITNESGTILAKVQWRDELRLKTD